MGKKSEKQLANDEIQLAHKQHLSRERLHFLKNKVAMDRQLVADESAVIRDQKYLSKLAFSPAAKIANKLLKRMVSADAKLKSDMSKRAGDALQMKNILKATEHPKRNNHYALAQLDAS